jgi:uncharacterized protein involved in response to NO
MNTRIAIDILEPRRVYRGPAILSAGHRPFFLAAGIWAAAGLALWVAALAGLVPLAASWHGHEMLFGFAVAAIAGFLTAAVPKWTNGETILGTRLSLLLALWLLGRIAMIAGTATWLDLLFLPTFAGFIFADIFRARNKRNYQVPGMLFALAGLNALYHFYDEIVALHAATYLITGLIALIGGRIVPGFTQNALRMAGHREVTCRSPRWLEPVAVPSVILVVLAELLAPDTWLSAGAAAFAGSVLLVRMKGWHSFKTFNMPIVWILHVGYAWVPIGYLLKATSGFGIDLVPPSAALHALTAGAIGTMILAVASRAALGHAGLPLKVSRWTVLAYLLVIAGAALRVAIPHPHAMVLAGALWSLGYAIFAVVYFPILTRPRVDGLPG